MNKLTRRAFLQTMAASLAAAGCSQVIDTQTQPGLPEVLQPPSSIERHPIAHLLNRATYGPRPGQIEAVINQGREAWINEQLDYASINDDAVALRLRRFDTLKLKARELIDFGGGNHRYARRELATAALIRAVYSQRQLYEVMVGFWTDHFNIYHYKGDTALLKTIDDRDVIRPHAMGRFADLLTASAHSPAMLVYLDNARNYADSINENYAREIMELHTLGVNGGYTEDDIKEVAKCFTGWAVNHLGEFTFRPEWHVGGEKTVLGHRIRSDNPEDDGSRVLEILAQHPSTARYVSAKLVRRFVADDPPQSIVNACIDAWNSSNGDLRAVCRAILTHPEFDSAPPKLKRPLELTASLLRVTNASYDGSGHLIERLETMGHRPFAWATPDGYPDTAIEWTGNMLDRWNFCLDALTDDLPGVGINLDELAEHGGAETDSEKLRFFGRLLLNRDLDADNVAVLDEFYRGADQSLVPTLGLLAASPAFQWR